MVKKTRENTRSSKQTRQKSDQYRSIVLYNDDINSFDFVIDCLIGICKHNKNQAEQCAYITHFKGKCDIKTGKFDELKPLKNALIKKGLKVKIE
ncbi:MAG: ATP-dependent Clp protease adaptor ClpS [Bacteroidales bacterium]|jgi:ATP-dependent Clp protease adaptor protein ClpS